MTSVNTNYGAMVALQQLNKTNSELETTQSRINTGLKVASAKDNGAIFAIAQGMRADVASYDVVQQSLDRTGSTVDTAVAAGEAVSDLLVEMKEKALGAKDDTLTTEQRAAYNEDFKALRDQITTIVDNAEFNGANLLKSGASDIVALANADGTSTLTVGAEDLSLAGSTITLTAGSDIDTVTKAGAAITALETSIDNVNASLARLGTGSKAIETHSTFVTKLSDAMENGIGNLVDADLAKESAKLQSLQTKQQLGVQALSIANSSSGLALSFFR
ncbi:flagellin [Hirschia baltica]|uniref:Flagellin n=1 Tax=Hirschia baltica (strain ATCC 49814 / DSM 5838 / IFAM 1418) TaxID=582402 RepID=C6XMT5_HIRBI|nr:flagellin [Hirschia baltica]ACT59999.1 flagellin domain protein [Hirschia baltica ATCC 49814]